LDPFCRIVMGLKAENFFNVSVVVCFFMNVGKNLSKGNLYALCFVSSEW